MVVFICFVDICVILRCNILLIGLFGDNFIKMNVSVEIINKIIIICISLYNIDFIMNIIVFFFV